MNTKILLIVFISTLFSSLNLYSTDWDSIINIASTLKSEVIKLDSNGLIKAEVVRLPNKKFRLVRFNSFLAEKKPILTLSAMPGTNLNELCQGAVLYGKKFKAHLLIQTNPLLTNSKTQEIEKLDLNSFENTIALGPAILTFEKKQIGWTQYDYESISKSNGRPLTDYYEELISAQLLKSGQGASYIDLSNMNALACDLMQGRLVFSINRSINYEPGLPDKKTWLELNQYTSVYQSFWKLHPQITNLSLSPRQVEIAEALALGMSINSKGLSDEILKSSERIQKLLFSVKLDNKGLDSRQKSNVRSDDVIDQWMMTAEFTKPVSALIKQDLTIGSDAVIVKYEN